MNKSNILQVIAWVIWAVFLLFCSGASFLAVAIKTDVYFVRHYEHFAMNKLTAVMTAYPGWMIVLPFLWLPVLISCQRKRNLSIRGLLLLTASMFLVALTMTVLLLCSGPGFQM